MQEAGAPEKSEIIVDVRWRERRGRREEPPLGINLPIAVYMPHSRSRNYSLVFFPVQISERHQGKQRNQLIICGVLTTYWGCGGRSKSALSSKDGPRHQKPPGGL